MISVLLKYTKQYILLFLGPMYKPKESDSFKFL